MGCSSSFFSKILFFQNAPSEGLLPQLLLVLLRSPAPAALLLDAVAQSVMFDGAVRGHPLCPEGQRGRCARQSEPPCSVRRPSVDA